MYHRYLEQIIFTKLITPLKFDEHMELMSLRLESNLESYVPGQNIKI